MLQQALLREDTQKWSTDTQILNTGTKRNG